MPTKEEQILMRQRDKNLIEAKRFYGSEIQCFYIDEDLWYGQKNLMAGYKGQF